MVLRYISTTALAVTLVALAAAGCDREPSSSQPPADAGVLYPQSQQRSVDLLFVIDNSVSMAGEQAIWLSGSFSPLTALKNMVGGLPDMHVGVISTDLGTGSAADSGCSANGDDGRLLTGNCTNPVGAPYIVDVAPKGCDITREASNNCLDHTCGQEHCAHEPSTTFVVDSTTGCPRCRNYSGESMDDVITCIADLGTLGCNWEQPLESMHRALDPNNSFNSGFQRNDALLGIVFMTDEDDCSARDDELYGLLPDAADGPLGPFTSFRCFEHGITCDVNDRFAVGTRSDCLPREDSESKLHPLVRYIDRLDGLQERELVSVAVIGGPTPPSTSGDGFEVEVQLDNDGNPLVQETCTTAVDGALPGIRLRTFAAAFSEPAELDTWAYSSVCAADFTPPFAGIGNAMRDTLGPSCLPAPLKGCADPGVMFGNPRAPQTCAINETCLPQCTVADIHRPDQIDEERYPVPPCLEVAPDGTLLQGNTDFAQAYAAGYPNLRDANLPVSACWFINYHEQCEDSNYAEILVARVTDPPPRTWAEVSCALIPRDEVECYDGLDDDEDCLLDTSDPCCQNPANCIGTY